MVIVRMRRRRATPKTPLLNDRVASSHTVVAPGLDRGAPPPPRPHPIEARVFVYRMLVNGASREQIVDMGAVNVPPFGKHLIFSLFKEIALELRDARNLPEHQRDVLRAMQIESIQGELVQVRTRRARSGISTAEWTALTREARHLSALLADLSGTRMPVEIDVTIDMDVRVRSATMRIVQELTAEQFDEMGLEILG